MPLSVMWPFSRNITRSQKRVELSYSSLYGHMTHYVVYAGEYVSQGQIIGYVGSTGWSTGAHLHFTIYYNGSTVNPMDYI